MGNKKELLLLTMIFSAPFIAGGLIYHHINFRNSLPPPNYGDWIRPPIHLADTELFLLETQEKKSQLYGKWNLIYYLVSDGCMHKCRENVKMLRNLRRSLGKNANRTQIVVTINTPILKDLLGANERTFNWEGVFFIKNNNLRYNKNTVEENQPSIPDLEKGFYIVDPAGNMVMRYNLTVGGADILWDIKRLLHYPETG